LRSALIGAGIDVGGEAYDIDDLALRPEWQNSAVLHTHRSATLAELAQPLLKDSINLYGEAVLRLNAPATAFPTNDAALDGLRLRLASWGVPSWGQQLVDGSGLSRRDALAPETLVLVLARLHDPTMTSPWMTALPIAGVDGSLAARMRGTAAERRVRAKTGSMSNVRALAGYAVTNDGEHLAFAVILNNFDGTGAEATAAVDAIAVKLAGFSRRR
jgi:D-alanyl-D-alanine carboxypeptidase/D-alanyl-D-alanine-endopeptidase (penicillin-binding protein 4)